MLLGLGGACADGGGGAADDAADAAVTDTAVAGSDAGEVSDGTSPEDVADTAASDVDVADAADGVDTADTADTADIAEDAADVAEVDDAEDAAADVAEVDAAEDAADVAEVDDAEDAAADVAEVDDAEDAADTEVGEEQLVVTTGPQGRVRLYEDAALAEFISEVTVVRAPSKSECVLFVHAQGPSFAVAGTVTVGGAVVAGPGGLSSAVSIPRENGSNQYFYFGAVFPKNDTYTVDLTISGNGTFAALPTRTYRPPAAATVAITSPTPPTGGDPATLAASEDLAITWQIPSGDLTDHHILFALSFVQGDLGTEGELYCNFPLAAGAATVPEVLLSELARRTGAPAGGLLDIAAGDGDILFVGNTLYVVLVTRPPDSASYPASTWATLQ
ncbi:MAG: hypothetical protein H6745_29915 [Deltaproteobacteria bacterium]|nr:hypothetical protein [Deltaproteobacteria bacterium]